MKKFILRAVVQIIIIVIFTSGSLTVFGQTSDSFDKSVKVTTKQVDIEEKVSEEKEVVQEEITPQENVIPVVNNVYKEPVGNRIVIGNILNKQLVNDAGEYFYLDHDINGNYDGVGIPFIDSRTNFNTQETIIYAHSSQNGNGPFQVLQNYHNNPGYYYSNPYIEIYYNGNYYKYQIFSVYVSVADNEDSEGLEYFHNISYDNSIWGDVLNKYKSKSDYDTGVEVNSNDKIIILQTCSMDPKYYEKYYRYNLLIMGKLI